MRLLVGSALDRSTFPYLHLPKSSLAALISHCSAELQRANTHSIVGFAKAEETQMFGTILIIILILLLIGALPTWGYSSGWGYYPGGGLGIILIIVVILVLMGRI